jgi:protein phosphatase
VRGNNEDNFYCDGLSLTPENRDSPFAASAGGGVPRVFAVFDGMGGAEDGEFASLTAAQTLARYAEHMKVASGDELDAVVQDFVTDVNDALCREMRARSIRMGATLALAVVTAQGARLYTIGDSRIYAFANGALQLLSEDHTVAMQKMKMGIYDEEKARRSGDWSKLNRCLGTFEDEMYATADVRPMFAPHGGYRLLLCSDGLTDMVRDDRIAELLRGAKSADEATAALLDEALRNGGRDNVTCVVADVPPRGMLDRLMQKKPRRRR